MPFDYADDRYRLCDPRTHHQPGRRPEWGIINMRERVEASVENFISKRPGKKGQDIVEVPRMK